MHQKENTTEVNKAILHPKYVLVIEPFKNDNDIALIYFNHPFDLNLKNVVPVCLQEANNDPANNLTLTVSGYEVSDNSTFLSDHLMAVQVPVVNRTYCNDQLKASHDKGETNITTN